MQPKSFRLVLIPLLVAIVFAVGCGAGGNINNTTPSVPVTPAAQASTVFVIVMENKNYSDVVGSTAMPFFNSLLPKGALATRYYANVHPSIGNYFMMTTGIPAPLDDGFSGVVSNDNIARDLVTVGKTWKVYAENLPSVGYIGGDQMPYLRRHNPFSYFSDVVNNSAQAANIVPFTQLSADMNGGTMPSLAFIVPNAYDTGHQCPSTTNCSTTTELQQSDAWLSSVIPGIMASAAFKKNGILIVTWDESDTDLTNGGGKVATLFLGPQVKVNYQSTASYQHQDLLRMMCFRIGLAGAPGTAEGASTMSEFFQ